MSFHRFLFCSRKIEEITFHNPSLDRAIKELTAKLDLQFDYMSVFLIPGEH